MPHISIGSNSKLGVIPSVSLPVDSTCRSDAPCYSHCYARKHHFKYDSVQKSYAQNLAEFLDTPAAYFDEIIHVCNDPISPKRFFRYHASGDIPNKTYFIYMVKAAVTCKDTKFLCYTKNFEIVNDYLDAGFKLPDNLIVVFSYWDKAFKIDNPHNLPVNYCILKDQSKMPEIQVTGKTYLCPGTGFGCQNCLKCWSLKPGDAMTMREH